MIYCFDLDNTLCKTQKNDYLNSFPDEEMIKKVNELHDLGNEIIIFTARGMTTCKGDINLVYNKYFELTKQQLKDWKIKYTKLILGKPSFDFFIDDKNLLIKDFKKQILPKKGFIAGCFDVIHPGYIEMFEKIKENCNYLLVGLHKDPSVERPQKTKPILSISERKKTLLSLKYIDEVLVYETEQELLEIIKKSSIDILFLGDDYKDKIHNGHLLNINTIYLDRNHNWSATKFKKLIYEQFKN
jgi:glycerol-3-phosphate cytidylyltransferase